MKPEWAYTLGTSMTLALLPMRPWTLQSVAGRPLQAPWEGGEGGVKLPQAVPLTPARPPGRGRHRQPSGSNAGASQVRDAREVRRTCQ
eukprot:8083163-Pyramimonas_sp.AAC.1